MTAPDPADRWPAWFALVGFVAAFMLALLLAGGAAALIAVATGIDDPEAPGVVVVATVLQDAAFILAALGVARQAGPVTVEALGLRAVASRTAIAWTVGVGVAFYAALTAYSALVRADAEQDVLETLGADQSTGLLIAAAVLVIVLAPFAEEILFRGFMYRSLRNRLGPLAASLVIGAVFGSIHYSGPETLALIPPLVALGVAFCVLYERTGSLYPAIALHAINNALTFSLTAGEHAAPVVGAVALAAALGLCAVGAARSRA